MNKTDLKKFVLQKCSSILENLNNVNMDEIESIINDMLEDIRAMKQMLLDYQS